MGIDTPVGGMKSRRDSGNKMGRHSTRTPAAGRGGVDFSGRFFLSVNLTNYQRTRAESTLPSNDLRAFTPLKSPRSDHGAPV